MKIYGEALQTVGQAQPWAGVIYGDDGEITRTAANSREEAEKQIVYLLEKLANYARRGCPDNE